MNHFDDKGNEVSQYCLVNTKTDETTLLDPKYTIKQEGNKTFAHYTNNEGEKIKKQFVDLNDDRFGLVKRVIGSKERYTQI
ncbi:hypothetical protein GW750_02590 [bacterium]|nr:hypothetical protein [bacterium]